MTVTALRKRRVTSSGSSSPSSRTREVIINAEKIRHVAVIGNQRVSLVDDVAVGIEELAHSVHTCRCAGSGCGGSVQFADIGAGTVENVFQGLFDLGQFIGIGAMEDFQVVAAV